MKKDKKKPRLHTNSGSLRLARIFPFSPVACLLGLFTLGELSRGGGGGGGGGATFSLLGEMVSSNHCPRMGSLSSSERINKLEREVFAQSRAALSFVHIHTVKEQDQSKSMGYASSASPAPDSQGHEASWLLVFWGQSDPSGLRVETGFAKPWKVPGLR